MYGLKLTALLVYNFLKKNLAPYGYYAIPHTVGLWKHATRPILFCLCIDNFGVQYFHKQHINHLMSTLTYFYKISLDCSGKNYCGLTFDWCYNLNYVDISIPSYLPSVFICFHHDKPSSPILSPIPLKTSTDSLLHKKCLFSKP